ncbi:type I glyceraldehyde-3-phosphate dehydrogenase [Candidatus Berkelbacteria bacterium]|nr:type I glyceraldehyde-3-phosphate dehydrogenase [Candidatus Berkelbacteria bacterium]
MRIAINGFGRIGRQFYRLALEKNQHKSIVAVNDLTEPETLAYLLKYDSVYGTLPYRIEGIKNKIKINNSELLVLSEPNPRKLPWKKLKIDIVIEATGHFNKNKDAFAHIKAGAKRVIISAPHKGENNVPTFLMGVNVQNLNKELVVSNASCTTNSIAAPIAILRQALGVLKAMVTTAHGYTSSQSLVDGPNNDLRRARAAAINIVPTSTGAAIATTEAIPELKGLFDGVALRVPLAVGSISDITAQVSRKTSVEEVNAIFKKAAKNSFYRDVINVTEDPLVSSDIIKSPYAATIDLGLTRVVGGDLVKIFAWYDNEWGYAVQLFHLAMKIAAKIL